MTNLLEENDKMDQLISTSEAAVMLGISKWTLESWKAKRKIPFVRMGKRTLFSVSDLETFIEQNKVPTRN
jgi:excisionase family DNA binding protein